MSDTKALIKYVSDRLNEGPNITFGKPTVFDLVEALESAEAIAKDNSEALTAAYMSGKYDGRKEAEAEVARLTKERDWLAKALAEDGCPYLALWSDFGSEMRPDWCICIDTEDDGFDCNGDPKECWKKEAARKAVAAGGEPCQK